MVRDPGGARCLGTLCLHQLGTSPQTFEFYNRAILAKFLDVVAWNRAILANVLEVDAKKPAILANFLNVAVQGYARLRRRLHMIAGPP